MRLNGVINLCADKRQVFSEIGRALKPGGRLQFAGIANGKEVSAGALRNIDLQTDCRRPAVRGLAAHARADRVIDILIGPAADTLGGAGRESKTRCSRSMATFSWRTNRSRCGRACGLFKTAWSVAHREPRQVLLREHVPGWPKFAGALECTDMEMRLGRQPHGFAGQS
jgi:hypothetical protein